MRQTAHHAIDQSILTDSTIHLEYDAEVAGDLLVMCDDSTDSNTETEYWGTDEAGSDWRVHMAHDTGIDCECGAITGERCAWHGPTEETVVVEWMPVYLRASHDAAGCRGSYPHNGSERLRVERSCADRIMEADGDWARIEQADAAAYDAYIERLIGERRLNP